MEWLTAEKSRHHLSGAKKINICYHFPCCRSPARQCYVFVGNIKRRLWRLSAVYPVLQLLFEYGIFNRIRSAPHVHTGIHLITRNERTSTREIAGVIYQRWQIWTLCTATITLMSFVRICGKSVSSRHCLAVAAVCERRSWAALCKRLELRRAQKHSGHWLNCTSQKSGVIYQWDV